jgi:hypothetical protein
MAVAQQEHRHCGRANNQFESKPNGGRATRALDIAGELIFCYFIGRQAEWWSRHEGIDIVGKLIILFYVTASQMAVAPRGHRHRWQITKT